MYFLIADMENQLPVTRTQVQVCSTDLMTDTEHLQVEMIRYRYSSIKFRMRLCHSCQGLLREPLTHDRDRPVPELLVFSSFLSSSSLSLSRSSSLLPSRSLSVSLVSEETVGVLGRLLLLGSRPRRLPTMRLEGVLARSATTPAGYSLTIPS